jgi:hypothetical protein
MEAWGEGVKVGDDERETEREDAAVRGAFGIF